MTLRVLTLAIALLVSSSTTVLANQWSTMEEEAVSLSYGTEQSALLEIFCDDNSQVVVPEPGHVKPGEPVVFSYVEAGQTKTIQLEPEICGGELQCTDKANGEISAYTITIKGNSPALAWAKASSLSLKGPTIDLTMNADKSVFDTFAKSCKARKSHN